jgi:hypothetical protein
VTDGIDAQYDITYAVETGPTMDPGVASWIRGRLLPESLPKVEKAGHKIFYYVFPREENDLSKGLTAGSAPPRFSTGYGALQNRPFLLVETHMLKPYKTRVEATYHFLRAMIECVNGAPDELRRAVRNADQATIAAGLRYSPQKTLPLTTTLGEKSRMTRFLGIESRTESSDLSGGQRRIYTGKPVELEVPFLDEVRVQDSAAIPLAYLIPQEWEFAYEALRVHGVEMERLTEPVSLTVASYRFSDVSFRARPYEGRQTATYTVTPIEESRVYAKGTLVVRTHQRAAKVAMHLLEPKGPDSFAAWGFFNVIFEQKEYAESYVMEEVGRKMLREDQRLRQEFEQKVASDTSFARNPAMRLNWLYLRSPWSDQWLNKYPVGRLVQDSPLRTARVE